MPFVIRLLLAACIALLLAAPASAGQPRGSAAWTTDGWGSFSGVLRAGPGLRYDQAGTIGPGERVRVDRCSGPWCQIHTSAVRGWLPLRNLSFGQAPGGLFSGPKFPTRRGGPGEVCFYSGANYSGTVFCGKSGRVFDDLALIGRDNAVGSIEVGTGVSAMVCRDRGFRSWCQVIDVSRPRLDGLLSNAISAIRVY